MSEKFKVHIHPGTFVDSETFLDPNGNPYKLIPSKFPEKKDEKEKIMVNKDTGEMKMYNPDFGWIEV